MKGRAFYATVEIHNRLLDSQANKRLLTLGSGHYLWGGGGGGKGAVLLQKWGPQNFSPSQVNSPKVLPPSKKVCPKNCNPPLITL